MHHQQRDFTRSADDQIEMPEFRTGSTPGKNVGSAPSRNGFLAPLLDALHESRRLQAARIIHQYQDLIAEGRSFKALDSVSEREVQSGDRDMANGDYSRIQQSSKSVSLDTWILIAAALVGFGIIHVVGEIISLNASGAQPRETSVPAMRGD